MIEAIAVFLIKRRALRRAKGRCQRCGQPSPDLQVHHVIPISEGGSNEWGNAHVVCPDCHVVCPDCHRDLHRR